MSQTSAPPTASLATNLAKKLRDRICREQLDEGHLFMTETQVAEEYNVSRTIVREAVSRLRALGILDGRQRKGLVVRRPDPLQLLSDALPLYVDSTDRFQELLTLRYVLEVGAIELSIKNGTDEQIDQLDNIVAQMIAAIDADDAQAGTELDIQFHTQLLEMTGSTFVAGMQQVLVDYFRLTHNPETLSSADAQRIIWEHRELANAIRSRDVERARSMIRVHFHTCVN